MPTVDDLFEVRYGNGLSLEKLEPAKRPGGVNFVGRSGLNNGVTGRVVVVSSEALGAPGEITVALSGSILAAFVQPEPFVTAYHVAILRPRAKMTLGEKLWWCQCIFQNQYRYSYGRQANRTLERLVLPKTVPAWAKLNKPCSYETLAKSAKRGRLPHLEVDSWKPFLWSDLFDVRRGSYVPAIKKSRGFTPCVSSSSQNNGWSRQLSIEPNMPPNTISVARNGSIGEAFYQPVPYFATDDVHVLIAKGWEMTASRGLFLAALIRSERYRYNYGRKWTLEGMRSSVLYLPANTADAVDWNWIDRYMSMLPWSKSALHLLD